MNLKFKFAHGAKQIEYKRYCSFFKKKVQIRHTNYYYFDEFCLKGTQIYQFSFNNNILYFDIFKINILFFIFRDKPFTNGNWTTPSFYVGKLHIPKDPEDTYLDMSSWGKVKCASYLVSWFHTGKQNGSGCCQLYIIQPQTPLFNSFHHQPLNISGTCNRNMVFI